MSTEEFFCHSCVIWWRDEYSFWSGYCSPCPRCGGDRQAVRDTQEYADHQVMEALRVEGPLFDFESDDRTEADLEAERDVIHDEIAEAVGAAETEKSGADKSDGADADTDADADAGGDGF